MAVSEQDKNFELQDSETEALEFLLRIFIAKVKL